MTTPSIIRIATRSSPLALWQATAVKNKLALAGYNSELILIESTGDMLLTQPIYALGITGVFTKQLDIALLNHEVDIAVHSLKDVPTELAENIFLSAVLKRGSHEDVAIVKNKKLLENNNATMTIATSSLRRTAQWLAKYPKHKTIPIRGNVQTRLLKFAETSEVNAVIFAKAGLERLELLTDNCITLDWMLPAAAQGIIGIACREDDKSMIDICHKINHHESFREGFVERQFLKTLLGGCSVPISALAQITENKLSFRGAVHAYDGSKFFEENCSVSINDWKEAGKATAEKLLLRGGATELMEEIRNKKWDDEGIVN